MKFLYLSYISDINECDITSHHIFNGGCHPSAICSNTQGSYICKCLSGYSGKVFRNKGDPFQDNRKVCTGNLTLNRRIWV